MISTFKAKLITVTVVSITSFILIGLFFSHAYYNTKELAFIDRELANLQYKIVSLKNAQTNFITRKETKYITEFQNQYTQLINEIKTLTNEFDKKNFDTTSLSELTQLITTYKKQFDTLTDVLKEIGLSKHEGLYLKLENNVHNLENNLKKYNLLQLQVDMLMLRRAEKDFMLREESKYFDKHTNAFITFLNHLNEADLTLDDKNNLIQYANSYKAVFYDMFTKYKQRGLTVKDGLQGQTFASIEKIDKLIGKLSQDITTKLSTQEQAIKSQTIWIFIVLFAIMLTYAYFITKQISKQISNITRYIKEITTEHDLSIEIPIENKDEISHLAKDLNVMFHKLNDLIEKAKATASENSSIAHQLSSTSTSVGQNISESVTFINKTVQDFDLINENLDQSLEESNKLQEQITKADEMLAHSKDEIINLTRSIQESSVMESELAQNIQELANNINETKNILDIIADIAEQTNLLALNAAIEAARAGEHGRGFAVVADEVRKLAERTQKSLTEINATIKLVVQASTDASEQMSNNAQKMESLSTISINVESDINTTAGIVNHTREVTNKTVENFQNTGTMISNINTIMLKVDESLKDNAKSTEEIADASKHLDQLTLSLANNLDQFKTTS